MLTVCQVQIWLRRHLLKLGSAEVGWSGLGWMNTPSVDPNGLSLPRPTAESGLESFHSCCYGKYGCSRPTRSAGLRIHRNLAGQVHYVDILQIYFSLRHFISGVVECSYWRKVFATILERITALWDKKWMVFELVQQETYGWSSLSLLFRSIRVSGPKLSSGRGILYTSLMVYVCV